MTAPILAVHRIPILQFVRAVMIPLAVLVPLAATSLPTPAEAGPVLCTTTLEAPSASAVGAGPVEVTRCGVTRSVPEVIEHRYYSYSPPFARGINLLHQITDPLGLSIPGRDGGGIVAFGFHDQNIVWDGTAIENTTAVMMTDQSSPMPLRTSDITNGYGSSLGAAADGRQTAATSWTPPIRGLW